MFIKTEKGIFIPERFVKEKIKELKRSGYIIRDNYKGVVLRDPKEVLAKVK